jgi:hypothetical protein
VKIAKKLNVQNLPQKLNLENKRIDQEMVLDAFPKFFRDKVDNIAKDSITSNTVYNVNNKVSPECENFMCIENVK